MCTLGIIGRASNCDIFLIGSHSPPSGRLFGPSLEKDTWIHVFLEVNHLKNMRCLVCIMDCPPCAFLGLGRDLWIHILLCRNFFLSGSILCRNLLAMNAANKFRSNLVDSWSGPTAHIISEE